MRVGLSGVLLMVYGVGAGLGPVVAGKLMDMWGTGMFYVFTSACAFILALFISRQKVSGRYRVQQEPFVLMPIDIQPAPAVLELDPRVDLSVDISADEAQMEKVIEQLKADEVEDRLEQEKLEQEKLEQEKLEAAEAGDGGQENQSEEEPAQELASDVAVEIVEREGLHEAGSDKKETP